MADTTEGARFWLPSEFFDDCLMAEENLDQNEGAESDSEFFFPTEFPYDFGDEQYLMKRRVLSTSPQSTPGIWGGCVPSSQTTPSGLVPKLGGDVAVAGPTDHKGPPKSPYSSVIQNIYLEQQKQSCGMWYSGTAGRAWPIERRDGARTVLFGGGGGVAAVKRECAGTGVFLPRRYGNSGYSLDSRRRPGGCISNRNVDALNNLDNSFPQSQPHFQPNFSRGFVAEYDLMMARRNAIMLQERWCAINHGLHLLPQEWTY